MKNINYIIIKKTRFFSTIPIICILQSSPYESLNMCKIVFNTNNFKLYEV